MNKIITLQPWVTLGKVDMETLIENHFKDVGDWEQALRMIKTKGRDVDKLPT